MMVYNNPMIMFSENQGIAVVNQGKIELYYEYEAMPGKKDKGNIFWYVW